MLAGLLAPTPRSAPCLHMPCLSPALCRSTPGLSGFAGVSAKTESSVLYDPPSLVLSCEKREDFQPSSSLPPSGKPDFSHYGERSAEQTRLHDAWTSPLQPICQYPPGTSQWPPKARAAPRQRVSCLLAASWLRGHQGMVGRSCPLQHSLFLGQIGTIQAYFPVKHQAKEHLKLQHLNASQCSSSPPKKS